MSTEQNQVITAAEVAHAATERKSLVTKFADKYGLEANKMMATLKATAFKGEVTNEQMAALLIVADAHNLNPWLKEIYAFPSRNGIVPMVSVDGWARIINEHPQLDGIDFTFDKDAQPREGGLKGSYTCTIHRKDREHPTTITEYMDECFKSTDPWKSHPLRMLRHKSLIQCARLAFSFAGIYDQDEAERIVAAEEIDVTPRGEPDYEAQTDLGHAKIGAVKMRRIVEGLLEAAKNDDPVAYLAVRNELNNAEWLLVWKQLRSYERTALNKIDDKAKALPPKDLVGWSITAINTAASADELLASWNAIQGAFQEVDQEVPTDICTVYQDRKQVLAVP